MSSRILRIRYQYFLLIIFLLVLLSSSKCHLSLGFVSEENYKNINVDLAKELIENRTELFILDVRTNSEFEEGHIASAYLIPHIEITDRKDELPDNFSQLILVYCKSGTRSAIANNTLVSLFYTHIYNMAGGFTAWKNAGYLYETGAFVKPVTNTTSSSSSSLITPSSSSAGLTSSSSTTSLITPGFGIFLVFQAICIIFMRSKNRK